MPPNSAVVPSSNAQAGLPFGGWILRNHQGRGRYSCARLFDSMELLIRAARCGSSPMVTRMSYVIVALQ